LDLEGRVLWQKNVGHCVALTALPRGERGAVAGLFLPPSQPPYVGDSKPQPWFVAAFDPADGKEIWRIETPGRTAWGEVETFYPFRENDRAGVVVSLDRVRVISSDGEQLFESKPEGERAQHKVVAVTDLDGDRRDEIVVCSGAYPSYGGRLQILDLKGKPLWASPEKDRWAFAACEDLDGDGWKELVVKSNVPIPGVGVFGLKPEERK
jgi:outer membrane protein assembly factor BamB